jgi:hypothetical protein
MKFFVYLRERFKRDLGRRAARMAMQLAALALAFSMTPKSFAGVDVTGVVSQIWIDGGGNLWFRLNNTSADAYCAFNWSNNNLYVSVSDQNFPFYYGILLASLTKSEPVDVPNISIYNGSTSCDITKTNYGIMLEQ